jgi:prenyltransferase beta subunit
MRRRVQAPTDGETAATAKLSSDKVEIPLYNAAIDNNLKQSRFILSRRYILAFFGLLVAVTSAYVVLKLLFPKHRYQHLLDITEVQKLLEDAPAPINEQYVVFVSNANGKSLSYNVAFAESSESAENALKIALTKLPLISARYPWFKIDVITASKVLHDYDFGSNHNAMPSWWFGLSMDWTNKWVFLPDEVQAYGLVDGKNRLLWERIGNYAASHKLVSWPKAVLEDDSTQLAELEVLHTNSIFCDFETKEIIPLYHGHRLIPKLTHSLLMASAERAGDYLARNVHPDGKMVYTYRPITDTETSDYSLTRHAGTVYSMAALYSQYRDQALNMSMKRALDYLMNFVHDCPLPYHPTRSQKCVWDYTKVRENQSSSSSFHGHSNDVYLQGEDHVTKLGLNSLTILAVAEYVHATKDLTHLEAAKSIASWIEGSQREDGSFVQKVGEPDNKLDEKHYVRYYQGEASFGMARLYNVMKEIGQNPPDSWMNVAESAAKAIVLRDSQIDDDDLLVDHWLLYGIAEMGIHQKQLIQHCQRTIEVASSRQIQESSPGMDKDRLGIFGNSMSGTATATKTEGMCAVYNIFAKKEPEVAATILDVTSLAVRFQLQLQFRPETAMYLKHPLRVLGGFRSSLNNYDMRNDYTQHNLSSLLCMARILKEQEVDWSQ